MTAEGILAALARAASDLSDLGVRHALVGGLAVSVRAEVRFTRDVDMAIVSASDAEVEDLVGSLRARGYRMRTLVEQRARGVIATVRMWSPGGVVLDLLAASSGIEREIVDRASLVDLGAGRPIPVAAAEELVAMKVLAMAPERGQDEIDIRHLLAAHPQLDRVRVEDNLRRIMERGFDRGEPLLDRWRAITGQA